jgi:hypothetical protein
VDDWLPLGVDVLVDEELVVASLVLVEVDVCVAVFDAVLV